jgi:2-methylisocitrate lyase-like PEP mutase family enzyme
MSLNVATFRQLHFNQLPLRLPNAWDAGSARLFEHLGASAIATSSAAMAWSLGYQDGQTLSLQELDAAVARMLRVLTVPLSVDIENGYCDGPKCVAAQVVRLAQMGVAGINIEDGFDSAQLLASKIEAIRGALDRANLDIFVNVRSDVFLKSLVEEDRRVDESIGRGRLYREAGADGLFLPALHQVDHIRAIARDVSLPLNVMAWPDLPEARELGEMGVRRLSAGSAISQMLWEKAGRLAGDFLSTGSSRLLGEQPMPFAELQSLFSNFPVAAAVHA